MTDAPIWPGVAEYLNHAARPACVRSDGTLIVPLALAPRCSSLECTPMAGISTDTGGDRCSDGPYALPLSGPTAPAAARAGCGACTWAASATTTATAPAMMRRTPASPAARARMGGAGGGAHASCGQDITTRNPAIRGHCPPPNAVAPSRLPWGVLLA